MEITNFTISKKMGLVSTFIAFCFLLFTSETIAQVVTCDSPFPVITENFDAGGAQINGVNGQFNIDSNGTGFGPENNSAPSLPNYLYYEASGAAAPGATFDIFTNVALASCTGQQTELSYQWHAAGVVGNVTVEVQASSDGGVTWTAIGVHNSGDTPNDTDPFTPATVDLTPFGNTVSIRLETTVHTSFQGDVAFDDFVINNNCQDPAPAPIVTTTLGLDGCTTTVDYLSCGSPVDIEVCPSGTPTGSSSCVIFSGTSSPFVFDACAAGFAPGTSMTITVSDPTASTAVMVMLPAAVEPPCGVNNIFFTENFDALPTGVITAPDWFIQTGGTGSAGTGPNQANSLPNYLYWETSGGAPVPAPHVFATGVVLPAGVVSTLELFYHFASTFPPNTVVLEISNDGGATWTNLDTYNSGMPANQADPFIPETYSLAAFTGMTVDLRFVGTLDGGFDDFAADDISISSACADGCPTGLFAMTADPIGVTNSVCTPPATVPSGGAFTAITCPAGSTAEYSIDGGMTYSAVLPTYDQENPVSVVTRCICDTNPLNIAYGSSVTTVPGNCTQNPPTMMCNDPIAVTLSSTGMASITIADIDNGSTSPSGMLSLALDQMNFTCADFPSTVVTLTGTNLDGGLTATCMSTVNVTIPAPTAACSDVTVTLDASAMASITPEEIDGGSSAVCGTPMLAASQIEFSCDDVSPVAVTLTVTDPVSGGTATCTSNVTITGIPPTAVCNDFEINLGPIGTARINVNSVDGALSSTICGVPIRTISQSSFDCTNVGINEVTLTVTDPVTNLAASCVSTVTVFGNQTCIDNGFVFINNSGPSIVDPCQCDGVGGFNEQIVVRDPNPMSQWDIITVNGLNNAPGSNADPIVAGINPLENIGLTGDGTRTMYTVLGNHLDGEGYEIVVTSPWYPGVVIGTSNTCFYPIAEFDFNLDTIICANTGDIPLEGLGLSQKDGVTVVDGTSSFSINGVPVLNNAINPLELGPGTHIIEFCFDAGQALGLTRSFDPATGLFVTIGAPNASSIEEAQDDPGCEVCVTDEIFIIETPSDLKCNDLIQASLDRDCEAFIAPDDVLEGSYECFDDYVVTLEFNGQPVANPLGANLAGQTIRYQVEHLPSGNTCWGNLLLEDKLGSEFVCSVAGPFVGTGTPADPVIVDCTFDLALIPSPLAVDNCTGGISFLQNESTTSGSCSAVTITRTYGSTDSQGNPGGDCVITIRVNPISDVTFPDDVVWSCEQFGTFPNIIDASRLMPGIANAFGTSIGIFGTSGAWDITSVALDDMRLLNDVPGTNPPRQTGSGVPNVFDLDSQGCRFVTTFADQILEAVEGAGTDRTFKILRTWTVLNWCTGETFTDSQVIKVLDVNAPIIDLSNFDTTFVVNETIGVAGHEECRFSGLIGLPSVSDDCSGVVDISLEIFQFNTNPNAAGQFIAAGIPEFIGGDLVGFRVPSPFLELGDRFSLRFTATDAAGNSTEVRQQIWIQDNITPTAVCREITQVSLATGPDGLAPVLADFFDEGSFDNCGPVFFKVRKMELGSCGDANIDKAEEVNNVRGGGCDIADPEEWFDDDVIFCCEEIGSTINVILRVYDRDPSCPGLSAVPTLQNRAGLHFDPSCLGTCPLGLGDPNGAITYEALNDGHYTDCMIEVLVEDKTRPVCVAPAAVWTNCADVPDNIDWNDDDAINSQFGGPSVIDNCGATVEVDDVDVQLDDCGVGRVIRTFEAIDGFDNTQVGSCTQIIMIQPITDYCITVPADFDGECNNANNPNDLTFVENGCDLLSVSREAFPLLAGSTADECRKERVVWNVINWCEWDGISLPIEIARNNSGNLNTDREFCSNGVNLTDGTRVLPSTGHYSYEQLVTITDNTAPVVTYNGDVKFGGGDINEDPCTGQVDIAVDVVEECTNEVTTTWAITAFSSTFSSSDITGSDAISQRLPLGTHTVRFFVSDDCGNTSFFDITFDVVDAKAPTPVCFNGLSVELHPSGEVEVWASDFDASSFDFCSDIELRLNRVDDVNGDGFITEDDYLTTPPADSFAVFTCDDADPSTSTNPAAPFIMVQLWVVETPGDGCNDADFCTTFIEVQDNMTNCNQGGGGSGSRIANVNGAIATEDGEGVKDVNVTVSGDITNNFMTDAAGAYSFTATESSDVSVAPTKLDDIRNGVSTFDISMIAKHILSVQQLDSPYRIIAADANNSGSVTTLDLVAIRKVVLFVSNDFPNNTSWRFVDRDFIFSNAQNPFADFLPEVKNFNNIIGTNTADFVAIKVGDVNGNADASGLGSIDNRSFNGTFNLNTENFVFKAGEEVRVPVTADFASIDGYQATLNFNTKALDLIDIETAEMTNENFGTTMTDNGIVTMSWNGTTDAKEAFTLVFTARANGTLENELSISSNYTVAEAYTGTDVMNVDLTFGGVASDVEFALHQNTPNPFTAETVIGFELPKADDVTLTISDLSGKVLRVIQGNYDAGYNSVVVEMTNNLPVGVLIYEVETSTDKATRKMTVVK